MEDVERALRINPCSVKPQYFNNKKNFEEIKLDKSDLKDKLVEHLLSCDEIDSISLESNNKHPPRPLNCFMIFGKAKRNIIKRFYPLLSNAEISKVLGWSWNYVLDEEMREYYRKIQKRHKLEHKQKYPNYKYIPNRKKKRKRKINQDINDNNKKRIDSKKKEQLNHAFKLFSRIKKDIIKKMHPELSDNDILKKTRYYWNNTLSNDDREYYRKSYIVIELQKK